MDKRPSNFPCLTPARCLGGRTFRSGEIVGATRHSNAQVHRQQVAGPKDALDSIETSAPSHRQAAKQFLAPDAGDPKTANAMIDLPHGAVAKW